MSAEYEIRKMVPADLGQVTQIEADNFSVPWKEKDFANWIEDPQAVFLTAAGKRERTKLTESAAGKREKPEMTELAAGECEHPDLAETVAGYIGCLYAADEGDITNVSVDSARRREGIGKCLVQALLAESRKRGCRRIFLEVRQSNDAAIRLYQGCGFVRVGVRKNYYTKPQEDALLMRCDLE